MDEIDLRIVKILLSDARTPNTRIAKAVGLSATGCKARIRRLEQRGVIASYTISISEATPSAQKFVMVKLDSTTQRAQDSFLRYLRSREDVVEVHRLEGVYEYMIVLSELGIQDHAEVVTALNNRGEVRRTTTISSLGKVPLGRPGTRQKAGKA